MLAPDVLRQVRRINIRARRQVDGPFSGHYLSVFKGQGIEFAEVRDYEPGDDIRTIDWNVTARMGRPFIKRQIEERHLTVMLLVDLSPSTRFGSTRRSKQDVAVEIAAALSMSALRNHDRVGMILFTDRIERFVPPKGGRNRTARLISELLSVQPEGTGTDISVALRHLENALHRRTVSFLLSDLYGPDFKRSLQFVARRHEIVPIWLRDRREDELPNVGLIALDDMETGASLLVDTGSPRVLTHFRERQIATRAARRRLFAELGMEVVEVDTSRSFVPPLIEYFRKREQRRRGR